MHEAPMQYLILVDDDDGREVLHAAPVPQAWASFLRERVLPTLQPLSDEAYMQGPAVILHTFAHYSYLLHGEDLLWCVEWDPGLLVLRLSPDGRMAWTAVRDPRPSFGGREPLPQDVERYDEDADNPLYYIVFEAWDAQNDASWREPRQFAPTDEPTRARRAAALKPVDALGDTMQARFGGDRYRDWADTCKRRIAEWAGEGLRLV